jgi:hypothetical protein
MKMTKQDVTQPRMKIGTRWMCGLIMGTQALTISAADTTAPREALEEIVVTGSRLRLTDPEGASPVAFVEMNVPLVSASMQWPAMRSLSLKLAGRYDEYSDFGHSTNPQGLRDNSRPGYSAAPSYSS